MCVLSDLRFALWLVALTAGACTGPNPAFRLELAPADGPPGADRPSEMGEMPAAEPAPDGGGPDSPAPPDADADADADVAVDVEAEVPAMPDADVALPPDRPPLDVASDLPPPDLAPDLSSDGTPAVNILAGLRAQWTFNEGTGTRANDLVGGNHGTLQQGAFFQPSGIPIVGIGASKYAVRFDGANDYLGIAVQSLPTLQQPKTLALWISPRVLSHPALRTIVAISDGSGKGVQLGTDGGKPAMWRWGQSQGDIVASDPLPALGWHHLVYTWDGQWHRLYVNGAPAGESSSGSGNDQGGAITVALLGRYDPVVLSQMYAGDVDDLRIYDRVINQGEIARLRLGE
jgi:hypothetical protein